MNSTYYIDPELFTVSPMADIGLFFSTVALLACIFGVFFFTIKGLKERFTRAIIFLIIINILGAVMQVSEASFLYMTISNTTYVWRNIMFQLCMISLNMLQLEIFQCFNGGLLRFRWFHSENIKYMRITSLIIHIICGWSSYLQGLAFPYEEGSIFAKWSPIGAAVYSVIICGIGLSQNMLILIRVRQHIENINSSQSSTPPRTSGANCIKHLIYFLLILDLLSLLMFVVSHMIGSFDNYLYHYALMQVCFGIFGIHMFAETFLFERIVNQFRKRAGSAGAGSNSQSGRTGLVSSSNVKTTGMSAGGGSPTTASSPTVNSATGLLQAKSPPVLYMETPAQMC